MLLRLKIIVVLAIVLLPVLTCQAAWMRQEGEINAMAGFTLSDNGNFFDRAGNRFRDKCGTAYTMPLQLEYGMSYYNTLFASTSFSTYSCGGAAGQVAEFNDFDMGLRGRWNLFANDHTWEVAAIIPANTTQNGPAIQPKHFGIRLGFNSSDRIDTYQSFSAGEMPGPNTYSYGVGVRTWTGHIPNELSGYLAWGHVLSDSVWASDVGGWYFSARLDGLASFGKEHVGPVKAGLGVLDHHDKFSLMTGSASLWYSLTPLSGVQFSVNHGLWGKNIESPLGLHVNYSKTWRN